MLDEHEIFEILEMFALGDIGFHTLYATLQIYYKSRSVPLTPTIFLDGIKQLVENKEVIVGEARGLADGSYEFVAWEMDSFQKYSKLKNAWAKIDFQEPDIGDLNVYFNCDINVQLN